jgi:polar amino acid transport system substrate-binding protein
MRRRTAALLALAGALIAAGCGDDDSGGGTSSAGVNYETVQSGVLTVGTEIPYPPFEYREGSELTGFDVELLDAMAEELDLRTEYVNIPFDTIFTALAAGRFDVAAAGFTVCADPGSEFADEVAERKRTVAPTDPYYLPQQTLFVDSDQSSGVETLDDISDGTRVGVLRGTAWVEYAEENLAPEGAEVVSFQGSPDMVAALRGGSIDVGLDDLALVQTVAEDDPSITPTEQIPIDSKYNFAVSKDNQGLAEALDEALAKVYDDGTYEELHREFFPDQELPPKAELEEC